MEDIKTTLKDIIELFYFSPFKIFNINTVDGESLEKPFGYFISLGITTSFDTMKNIRDLINNSDYGFTAKIVEIESSKSEVYPEFLNKLLETKETDIKKYKSEPPEDDKNYYGKSEVQELIKYLQEEADQGNLGRIPLIKKLKEIPTRLGENWEDEFLVYIEENKPKLFHKYVNYKKESGKEYRIGIYAGL